MIVDFNFPVVLCAATPLLKQFFNSLGININTGLLLALIGLTLSILGKRNKKRIKRLRVLEATVNDLTPKRKYCIDVYLEAKCNLKLKMKDFYNPPRILFSKEINLITVTTKSTNELNDVKWLFMNGNCLQLHFNLLENDEKIHLHLEIESSSEPELTFVSNIIGESPKSSVLKKEGYSFNFLEGYNMDFCGSSVYLGVAALISVLIIEIYFLEETFGIVIVSSEYKILIPWGWVIVIFILPLIVAIKWGINIHKNKMYWHKVIKWYQK